MKTFKIYLSFWYMIFHKRVEFWCEGFEYLDNRRLNIPVDRRGTNHYKPQLYVEQEDTLFLYQLPRTEVENNDEIGAANQNP